eukprot:scaffold3316_cov94-Skeletonema_marinoi.AAC.5
MSLSDSSDNTERANNKEPPSSSSAEDNVSVAGTAMSSTCIVTASSKNLDSGHMPPQLNIHKTQTISQTSPHHEPILLCHIQ